MLIEMKNEIFISDSIKLRWNSHTQLKTESKEEYANQRTVELIKKIKIGNFQISVQRSKFDVNRKI